MQKRPPKKVGNFQVIRFVTLNDSVVVEVTDEPLKGHVFIIPKRSQTCRIARSIFFQQFVGWICHEKNTHLPTHFCDKETSFYPSTLTPPPQTRITYLLGKISRSNFYFRVHWPSEDIVFECKICIVEHQPSLKLTVGP